MTKIHATLGFKLVMAAMVLALGSIGLGGVVVYKVSEDAIKVDAQATVKELAADVDTLRGTGEAANRELVDRLTRMKVRKFGAAWVMDRNGFLIAHIDPRFRDAAEAQQFIGDYVVNLNVGEQPIRQLGEKNIVHKAKLLELMEKYSAGFGSYTFRGETELIAFKVLKDRGWLVAVDQPTSTAYSELDRIYRVLLTACIIVAFVVFGFTWFAVRVIIDPYYREQEESHRHLELMNRELEASRKRLERAGNSLTRLYDLSIAMQYSGFLESHLPLVLGVAQERFEVDRILLFMPDEAGKMLRCRAAVGNVFESEEKIFVPIGPQGGGLYRAFLERRTITSDGMGPVPEENRIQPPYDKIRSLRSKTYAIFPLITKDKVIGVLGVDNKMSRRPLTREDMEAIENFSYKMAALIENTIHFQSIRKAVQEMEHRDPLTGLFNLRHIKGIAEEQIGAAILGKVPLSVGQVYISNFKEYNERNGYQRGDFVLQKTSELLKSLEVMGAVPGRCYGATFIVLFPGKNSQQAQYLLAQFGRDLSAFSFYGDKRLIAEKLLVKTTVVEYPRDSGQSFDEFYARIEE
ncbi:MAG TPA: diguanylate cyclase [Candidatus Methylomirabilis sp.]|nr:diguanylate cyclase [Candidatus Methylomirabilis sp.]